MTLGTIFKYLHILTMFTAVAVALGPHIIMRRVSRSGNVAAIKTYFGAAKSLGPKVPMLFGIGALFGLLAVWQLGLNFLQPWLIIAYVIVLALFIIGVRLVAPWSMRVGKAAAMNQGDTPSVELQAAVADTAIDKAFWIDVIGIALVLIDMVFKPFGM